MSDWLNFCISLAVIALLAYIVSSVGADKTILGMIASGLIGALGAMKISDMKNSSNKKKEEE